MSDAGYANRATETKKKRWWMAATIILLICALPVLIPVVLGAGAAAVGILLALAGCGIAVILGAGGCVIAGLVCLAALLFCGVVGSGFGLVMLFSTPASGFAVLGTSLMAVGAGVLGCLIVWQFGRFFVWAVRKLTGWLHIQLFKEKKNKMAHAVDERQAEWKKAESMEPERVWEEAAQPENAQEESGHEE